MKSKKKIQFISLILAVLMLFGLITGCGAGTSGSSSVSSSASSTSATRQVTDMEGNTITIPNHLKKVCITSWMGGFAGFVLLGKMDMVQGMTNLKSFPWLLKAYPQLNNVKDYGSFNNANIEEIVKGKFDLIISPSSAAEVNKKMQGAGLPVYVDGKLATSTDDVFALQNNEVKMVADLTGTQKKAQEYFDWCTKVTDMVKQRVSTIPSSEKKTAICARSNVLEVFGNAITVGKSIGLAGGINAAPNPESQRFYKIDAEALVSANPDYIFVDQTHFAGENLTGYFKKLQSDARYSQLTAVKKGNVYIIPAAMSMWVGGYEYPLGVLLMAKTMYPDLFKDVDVNIYIKEFFTKFMNYSITTNDLKIIAPNFDGANTFGLY